MAYYQAWGLRFDDSDDDDYEGIVKGFDDITLCVLLNLQVLFWNFRRSRVYSLGY